MGVKDWGSAGGRGGGESDAEGNVRGWWWPGCRADWGAELGFHL